MNDFAFQVGDRVKICALPPYLKSDDNMPMLRPPDLVEMGEQGILLKRKPGGYVSVRFSRGAFLIDPQYLGLAIEEPAAD